VREDSYVAPTRGDKVTDPRGVAAGRWSSGTCREVAKAIRMAGRVYLKGAGCGT
jgi:hypothetical protein